LTKEQNKDYVWQTSWGVSTRLIGALVMVHGDDRGLILPPNVAPIQVVIVPIYYGVGDEEKVVLKSQKLFGELEKIGFRVKIDDRKDKTPGWKFNEWELKGVPLRIEVGPKDVEKSQTIFVKRDTLEKFAVSDEEFLDKARKTMCEIQQNLLNKAEDFLVKNQFDAADYGEFKDLLEKKGGFIKTSWCGSLECEKRVQEETGATVRLIPYDDNALKQTKCFRCDKAAEKLAYFARSY